MATPGPTPRVYTPLRGQTDESMSTKPQIEFFRSDDAVGLRKRTLLSRAEFSQAVRSGKLRAVEQDPRKGGGYLSETLNRLAAESQVRIVNLSATPTDAAALTLARKDGRDVPDAKDLSAARLWVKATPARRLTLAAGYKVLNGGNWGCRMSSDGTTSFYRQP